MFGIGMPELLIILVVALIVVGPKKLPDLAKGLGKGLSEFRRATDEIKSELTQSETFQDFKEVTSTVKDTVSSMNPKEILDVKPLLDPKEPKENLEGRQEVIQQITSEEQKEAAQDEQAAAETAAESDPEPAANAQSKAPTSDA